MTSLSFHDRLCDYRLYERQIEQLDTSGRGLRQGEVSISRLNFHRTKVARILARIVAQGQYVSGPARRKTLVVDGKERVVFTYRLTDVIVHRVVADLLAEALEPLLSSRLYSYRKGTAWWVAVSDFARYLREHRKQCSEPTQRHMYVARRDIDSYTDSIPVGYGAPIWNMVRNLVAPPGQLELPPADWKLVEQVVRPKVETPDGQVVTLDRGVATGQPISCVLFNLYLIDLDRKLEAVSGGFYARYSDDILFAHPSPEPVRQAAAEIDCVLGGLGLHVKPTKSRDLYVTGAGRASAAWPEVTGTCAVPFMGACIRADGNVSLAQKKTRGLLRDVMARAQRTARALPTATIDEVGTIVCSVLNRMLGPASAGFLEARSAALVRRAVTDRRQLAQLDHWIARIVLRTVTGDGSVRAFRHVPYRRIRENWGLISLEHARNRWRRRRRS